MEDDRRIKTLELIASDAKADAENFDGQPFNGRSVGKYFGNHGASIAALADILNSVLKQLEETK